MTDKIIQIMPANGWIANFENDDESWSEPLVGFGLMNSGVVVPLIQEEIGNIIEIDETYPQFVWMSHNLFVEKGR